MSAERGRKQVGSCILGGRHKKGEEAVADGNLINLRGKVNNQGCKTENAHCCSLSANSHPIITRLKLLLLSCIPLHYHHHIYLTF